MPSGCSTGLGADYVHSWVAKFDTVALAGEAIRDPRLTVADILPELAYSREPPPDVILGTDFLRAHRVLVARSQRKFYFTYAGGMIFPATGVLVVGS